MFTPGSAVAFASLLSFAFVPSYISSPPLATATMRVQGVVVVVGDVRAGAGASSAANTQTPVTSVFRGGESLLMR